MNTPPPPAVVLTRRDAQRNMARFYAVEVQEDLFGGGVLVRRWGRIGTQGRECRQWFALRGAAEAECALWLHRKARRGYIDSGPPEA
ncbi:WGR domain-containing protein [Paenirhodobacter sp.]|uniref:WGR domain-containing protein n=1 Tax=Paenirhodobacter sp. TaxID=1965326 RepID=UPI003B3FDD31